MKPLAVIALGGNSLIHDHQKGTVSDQEHNVNDTCRDLLALVRRDYNLVIGHGNGPQVGNIILSNIAGYKMFDLPDMPLDIDVAYSQGFIGIMIEQQFRNVLAENKIHREILTIVTQVIVDKNDTAFKHPTKPVGPFYTKEEIEKLARETNSVFAEDPRGRGWRKVVPSPKPLTICNAPIIGRLAREGTIVIAAGGGGIPATYDEQKGLEGVDAVIDKDLALALLAVTIKADEFYILTDVPKVCLHFNTPQEKTLDVITVSEAQKYLDEGHFSEGSMAPKIRAAIQFVRNGGKETVITESQQLNKKGAGTTIVHD